MQAIEAPIELPAIPRKRYFAIGEVADLCQVKPHVLRYWEQEFPQLKPVKRRGNRRYYQHEDVVMVRRIRSLLYAEGFTIGGARQRLRDQLKLGSDIPETVLAAPSANSPHLEPVAARSAQIRQVRDELESLLKLLR
ncbi:DNA-binding transcriptional MerR regulator [Panacagrimonas perspica]|uniref:DNA-binding transcriptional MerR regulator n=1 Tax=Panacagrimonas perspica TaxID=381431 RepID=A0A4R7PG18_9GAMM|nr:DNA-binding transcriptional MerR regulator [Panacagrimonas perspica]THD05612.1 MerR family transcriptional regulator [Panacagrimonas perspica]